MTAVTALVISSAIVMKNGEKYEIIYPSDPVIFFEDHKMRCSCFPYKKCGWYSQYIMYNIVKIA